MSKRKREYIRRLTHEDRVRGEIVIEKGRVSKFLIQYESFVRSEWRAIARYDTAHDHDHVHLGENRLLSCTSFSGNRLLEAPRVFQKRSSFTTYVVEVADAQ